MVTHVWGLPTCTQPSTVSLFPISCSSGSDQPCLSRFVGLSAHTHTWVRESYFLFNICEGTCHVLHDQAQSVTEMPTCACLHFWMYLRWSTATDLDVSATNARGFVWISLLTPKFMTLMLYESMNTGNRVCWVVWGCYLPQDINCISPFTECKVPRQQKATPLSAIWLYLCNQLCRRSNPVKTCRQANLPKLL